MTEAQKKYIWKHPSANYLLKHKDAVAYCVELLSLKGIEVDHKELETICREIENRCYIGSNGWIN